MLGRVYSSNQVESTAPHAILLKWSHSCLMFAKWGSIPCGACMSVLMFWPFAGYYLTGVLEPMLPTFFPFIDENSTSGYIFHFVFEFIICILGISGTCGADFMLFILIVHMWPLGQIFENMFKELNEGLMVEKNRNSTKMRDHFRNILMVHRDMCWFVYYHNNSLHNIF